MYEERIEKYLENSREEIIESIKRLVAIKSVKEGALPYMPFGKGPADALKLALEMSENLGFKIKNYENYVGAADMNDLETALGILVHLDVVGEGDGWTFEPYAGTLENGKLYGRGTSDDKGPAVAALFAVAAVKDSGIKLRKNVRLVFGTDEESGSQDMKYYFARESAPPCVFTPDGEFPVINTEKGALRLSFSSDFKESASLPRIISIKGGYRASVVPPYAEAVIEGLPENAVKGLSIAVSRSTGAEFTIAEEQNGLIKICSKGAAAHGSAPENGTNAVTALLNLLTGLPFADCEAFRALKAVYRIFPHGDYLGKAADVKMSDEVSGELTLNLGIFEYFPAKLTGSIDCRTPICATDENTAEILRRKLTGEKISIDSLESMKPHHTPEDSDFVKVLLSAYEKHTGGKGYCMHSGAGTYAHRIEGGVCFGCEMPGRDTRMHGADEFVEIEDIVTSAKIFAQVIIDLCT